MEPRCFGASTIPRPIASYREFAPCRALQADVYALFSFTPGSVLAASSRPLLREIAFSHATFCSPQLADGHVSLVFELGHACDVDGRWRSDSTVPRGTVIGPMSHVGHVEIAKRSEMVGVYFRPGRVGPFVRGAVRDLTDQTVGIDVFWGGTGVRLGDTLCELNEVERIDRLESALLAHLHDARRPTGSIRFEQVAATILHRKGRVTVDAIARQAGVSRQYLTRQFREHFGIGPKLYSRLARFQSGLRYAGSQERIDWAQVAVELGYADQSHLIADFRRFSGLTPQALAGRPWFHPFIERAKLGRMLPSAIGAPLTSVSISTSAPIASG